MDNCNPWTTGSHGHAVCSGLFTHRWATLTMTVGCDSLQGLKLVMNDSDNIVNYQRMRDWCQFNRVYNGLIFTYEGFPLCGGSLLLTVSVWWTSWSPSHSASSYCRCSPSGHHPCTVLLLDSNYSRFPESHTNEQHGGGVPSEEVFPLCVGSCVHKHLRVLSFCQLLSLQPEMQKIASNALCYLWMFLYILFDIFPMI